MRCLPRRLLFIAWLLRPKQLDGHDFHPVPCPSEIKIEARRSKLRSRGRMGACNKRRERSYVALTYRQLDALHLYDRIYGRTPQVRIVEGCRPGSEVCARPNDSTSRSGHANGGRSLDFGIGASPRNRSSRLRHRSDRIIKIKNR